MKAIPFWLKEGKKTMFCYIKSSLSNRGHLYDDNGGVL